MKGREESAQDAAAHGLAALLGLPLTADDDQIKQAFRAEVKLLHPDGGSRTTSETERLEALILARERYERARLEADQPDPGNDEWSNDDQNDGSSRSRSAATAPSRDGEGGVERGPWFTPAPPGPQPQPGFWADRPTRDGAA